ncbi:MAG: multidrug effflux MFS transporter [Sulfurospirillaceae bacterium]|nr:multidrug effflux MFS transporter [Sulfurospirillaceae bacterium]MDD2826086.1 multidrug effflux MFS transporter [Sulfurospirillaceae bacterium]
MSHQLSERQIVLTLAALAAITPLAIDMYLPAIPAISQFLNTSVPHVQVSLSLYFFGMAIGQLIGGPISDAYGRRPMIVLGLIVFAISSFLLSFVTQIEFFWLLRAIQAIGGGFATVNVSATVRDLFSGKESARIFSLISMIMLLAPLIAPSFGSLIISMFDWHTIFIILSIYAIFAMVFYIFLFPPIEQEKTKITPVANYIEVLTHKRAMLFIISQTLCTSGMYTFITSSSFIYMGHFHVSPTAFSLYFALNVFMMMLFGRLNAWLVKRIDPFSLLKFGMGAQAILGLILFSLHNEENLYLFSPLLGLYIGSLGFIFGNSVALILEFFPRISASANAIIGVLQYSVGALMGFIASAFHDGTLFPITIVMMLVSISGTLLLMIGTHNKAVSSS